VKLSDLEALRNYNAQMNDNLKKRDEIEATNEQIPQR
tara:strand:+ start:370 stop:480 length:111 start_codon:yes stop_codon:yes gene_type:complete